MTDLLHDDVLKQTQASLPGSGCGLACRIALCAAARLDGETDKADGDSAASWQQELARSGFAQVTRLAAPDMALAALDSACFDLLVLATAQDVECLPAGAVAFDAPWVAQIRQKWSASELPVVVLAAVHSSALRASVFAAGANDYLAAPVDAAELAQRLHNLLRFRSQHQAQVAARQALQQELTLRTARLDMLIENGLLMAMTRDRTALIRHTLFEGQRLLHCDAASMYLVTPNQSLSFAMRTLDDDVGNVEIPLVDKCSGMPNEHYVSTRCALHRQSILIEDVYTETRFDLSGTRSFDARTGYRTVSMLTVPMITPENEVLGVLQFINRIDPQTQRIVAFSADVLPLVEALAAQAAVTFANLRLIDERKGFMENLIHTIAGAIDAKSPHTGRHSARVPELAMLLAQAAHAQTQGSLADFHFDNEDEWHEFRVGAWLHDCGKITTPEYVIDKSAKLEMMYNRIHEVRMRFEVLLRDADIVRWKNIGQGGDAALEEQHFETQKARLCADFAFVAACNLGDVTLDATRLARLAQLGETVWMRHFDDRLGLSYVERLRRSSTPERLLPTPERLLADAAHHFIARASSDLPDPAMGFKVEVPHYLYNHGELYNLSIVRGTLTQEERYKMNEHMTHGIKMLERMQFPKSLQRVPEYAGTHHETLLGTGYPRRLTAAELSVPARIMMIADVFEAITACDRPYKKPNQLSEALQILASLKNRGLIDADLFDLFLTSGVYMQYAQRYLLPEQIDAIHLEDYLAPGNLGGEHRCT